MSERPWIYNHRGKLVQPKSVLSKVKLYTTQGELVTEVYSIKFAHWPQMYVWGVRTFAREDWHTNVACTQEEPPKYYEIVSCAAFTGADMAECGIV